MNDTSGVMLLAEALFAVVIGAVTFWGSCWTYSRLVGVNGPRAVPLPTPRLAIGITVLLLVIDGGANLVLRFCSEYLRGASRESEVQVLLATGAVNLLAAAVLASLFLPTTPRRAILIVLLQMAIEIVVGTAIWIAAAIAVVVCR